MKDILTLLAIFVLTFSCGHDQKEVPEEPSGQEEKETVGQPLSPWQEGQMDIHFNS